MSAPMWTSRDEVTAELGGGPYTAADLAGIEKAALVAHTLVCRWRPELGVSCSDADIRLGATKLGASLWRRRGASGEGFAEFADMSTVAVPGVIDAEIQALLGIGRHHGPVVA